MHGAVDGITQGIGEHADERGYVAQLDGRRGHADSLSPVAQHDLSLLRVLGHPERRTVASGVGDAEASWWHAAIMDPSIRRVEGPPGAMGTPRRTDPPTPARQSAVATAINVSSADRGGSRIRTADVAALRNGVGFL